jgi:hypothetical protein
MDTAHILMRYGILMDGSYNNEQKRVPLNRAEINNYKFK